MNEWLKNTTEKLKSFWKDSSVVKKAIFIGIILAIIVIFVVVANVSSSKTMESLFSKGITDQNDVNRITNYLDEKNIHYILSDSTTGSGTNILVDDADTALRVKANLSAENLFPSNINPYEEFNVLSSSWSDTDFERNTKSKLASQRAVQYQIEAIDDISKASVILTVPEDSLFIEQQKPVTASVVLTFKRGSNLASEKKRLQGIQSIILASVPGLLPENLKISDSLGNILNDFEGMADFDRLTLIDKQQSKISKYENDIAAITLRTLQNVVGKKRVKDVAVNLEMDFSKKTESSEIHSPIELTPQDPTKPYDTRVVTPSITISSQEVNKTYEGTSFNPEGPAGVEGQNPPTYSDMSNMIGKTTEKGVTKNEVVNTTKQEIEFSPERGRRTISAFIDGVWKIALDENGKEIWEGKSRKRTYTPVSAEEIKLWEDTVFTGTGCKASRGDSVKLTPTPFDHSEEFALEDELELKAEQTRRTVLLVLGVVAVILIGFILFRVISKEIEKRRRLREEELLRQQQAAREQALWDAKADANIPVTMSVEESRRAELLENATNLAKEHPEDVALLIRTWLMEE